jgi:hypothetical protein
MIRVQPVYKCLYCGAIIKGAVMELSGHSLKKKDLIIDVMDMAPPQFEPHPCVEYGAKRIEGQYGAIQYVGFNYVD